MLKMFQQKGMFKEAEMFSRQGYLEELSNG
jgi:hypothetical protein